VAYLEQNPAVGETIGKLLVNLYQDPKKLSETQE